MSMNPWIDHLSPLGARFHPDEATQIEDFGRVLTAADLADEHDPACRTPPGLLAVMQQLYPGFEQDETVTLVHFQWPASG